MKLLSLLPWLIVAAGCRVGLELVRQNGRILLRLDQLEQRLADLTTAASRLMAPAAAAAPPPSLPMGIPAPDFALPDLAGQHVALSALRGRRVLLIAFSPQCGFCTQMLPELATLPVDGQNHAPLPLVLTSGDAEQNRKLVAEHNLRCPVLLQPSENAVVAQYGLHGTPMGYLIDEAGRIASDVAVGAEALFAVARNGSPHAAGNGAASGEHKTHPGNRSLAESRLERNGLVAGTAAPDFTLPRVDGGDELSLTDFRGRPLLLVFSDPNCGPCMLLAPQLEAFHRRTPQIPVLVISRGEVEPNRSKVEEFGLSFPVVLQKQWEISRRYAMFATPIGYLIDERGIIAHEVAVGVDPILALATRAAITAPAKEAAVRGSSQNGAAGGLAARF